MAAVAKVALKSAKTALDAQNYKEAAAQARAALDADPKSYFGQVFLGRALEKQGEADEALKAYEAASRLKPDDELAWKGLCAVCESQGSRLIARYIPAALGLAQVYADKSDHHQSQSAIDKLVGFVKANGTRAQYKDALGVLLPTSPVYDFLEGRLQHPSLTYTRIAEITEAEEGEKINKEIGERRTRLGAKIGQVRAEVTREVFGASELEDLYRKIIDWSSDDEIRREYEERLLQRAYDHLLVLPAQGKAAKRTQVVKLAKDMVIIKHPYRLAWDLEVEWADLADVDSFDKGILREFVLFFPDSGVAKVIQAYAGCLFKDEPPSKDEHPSQEDPSAKDETKDEPAAGEEKGHEHKKKRQQQPKQQDEKKQDDVKLSTEERLLLFSDGLDAAKESQFAHRLASEHYLRLEEYEGCAEVSRTGLALVAAQTRNSGLPFEENTDALKTCLATSLVYYLSPKNHPEASSLFNEVLRRKPNSTAALLGIGLIYEEQEQYQEAASFLERASQRDPENVRIGAEAAWCRAQLGELDLSLQQLQNYLEQVSAAKNVNLDLKALISYRVGKLLWTINKDRASRKERKGAYAYFLAAIRANPGLPQPYTGLGLYYADYAKDKKRARQCFQKAFELSAAEIKAAERLARSFADDAEWDIVELISHRVIDSGAVKPAPGSKKKGLSWPFAAMGVVLMNKQEYPKAVVSFQAALRISPHDYNSWVGLGESYHSSGRYNAAKKTLEHAIALRQTSDGTFADGAWFADYMLANVRRELGEHEEAIAGYRSVLRERPDEFGVSIALLQTLVERAQHSLETGFFGEAADHAAGAIVAAEAMNKSYHRAFNFWKAVGDSCIIFTWIPGRINKLPLKEIKGLLAGDGLPDDVLVVDGITSINISDTDNDSQTDSSHILDCLNAAVKFHGNAIAVSKDDVHALAVGYYNLGWTQYRRSVVAGGFNTKSSTREAVSSFKRAIELEAGNADFWNALGVATAELNPKISQHSFVRSLHLNERSARTWTNLGLLYLLENDLELAHQAFSRAQSTDPEYAFAWVGQGTVALLTGDAAEASIHFTHATEIANATATSIKSQYLNATFNNLFDSSRAGSELSHLLLPIFTARQLQTLSLSAMQVRHMLALLLERIHEHDAAVELLQQVWEHAGTAENGEDAKTSVSRVKVLTDLARNELAVQSFEEVKTHADLAYQMSTSTAASKKDLSGEDLKRSVLSADLSYGLANSYTQDTADAVLKIESQLQAADGAPDMVCLLARVSWASNDANQRQKAKEQLFDALETHAGDVGITTLLGAMTLLDDDDDDTFEAILEELETLRSDPAITLAQRGQVERLLADAELIKSPPRQLDDTAAATPETLRSIVLHPSQGAAWADLAVATGSAYAARVAATRAAANAPPRSTLTAEELAGALAGTGSAADAQRAIMCAPWAGGGWASLAEAVSSSS